MSSSNSGRHALLRVLRELCLERSLRLPRRLRRRNFAVEPLEIRTLLSAVTPDSFTLVESGTAGQLNVLHERDWDAEAAPEWLATFDQQRVTQTAGRDQKLLADDFIAVDTNKTYGLSGWGRSGDNFGLRFNPANQQSLGIEEYDADYLRIQPLHVLKHGSSVDTTLRSALRPGDTEIQLTSVTGWSTSSNAATRALAWYGYANKSGTIYANYTYTRNVATGSSAGLWSSGGVNVASRTITLNEPWTGPTIAAGTAVRNATAFGSDHSAIALNRGAVPGDFTATEYAVVIGGGTMLNGGFSSARFAAGTAFVRPVVQANQHGATDNFVTWQDVRIIETFVGATVQDVRLPTINMSVNTPGNQTMRLPLFTTRDTQYHIGTEARIQVSPSERYRLSIDSIDMTEEDQNPVGFYSYDADGKLIHSLHVTRQSEAVDTRLARAVQPGDTAIYINDATGWSNTIGTTAESRSLAWYGYRDSSGTLYADYTYTRNVAFDFLDGLWNVGGITFDAGVGAWKITLRSNWSGPAIPNGTAVRNATGHTFVQTLKIPTDRFYGWDWSETDPLDWFRYSDVIGGGLWENGNPHETAFRPGTKYIQPTLQAVTPRRFAVEFGPVGDQGMEQGFRTVSFSGNTYSILNRSRQEVQSDELIPVSADVPVTLSVDLAFGTTMNSGQVPIEQHSAGYIPYDSDGLLIQALHVARYSDAVDTTLSQNLRPGDTEIVLTDASGWSNVGVAGSRAFAWYGYRDSSGVLYSDYSYTRNVAADIVNGLWDAGGIHGNVITLRQPWTGPTLLAGTAVRNAVAADDLIPVVLQNESIPNVWNRYSATLSGTWINGRSHTAAMPPGTASIRIAVRANENSFTADDVIHVRNALVTKSSGHVAVLQTSNVTIATLDVLANDAAATSGVSILNVTSPSFGTAQIIVGGGTNGRDAIRYQSQPWFTGTDQFAYTIRDNASGTTWTASVTLTNVADNVQSGSMLETALRNQTQNPSAHSLKPQQIRSTAGINGALYLVGSGEVLHSTRSSSNYLGDSVFEDKNNDTLSFSLIAGPEHGRLSLQPDGSFTYTSAAGFMGIDSFVVSVSDGLSQQNTRVAIAVGSTNEVVASRMQTVAMAIRDATSSSGYLGELPASYYDANGKLFLSWRVHLLQRIGYGKLFSQFHLNEPWNSAHNLSLLPQIPAEYMAPEGAFGDTNTRIQIAIDFDDIGSNLYLLERKYDGRIQFRSTPYGAFSDHEYSGIVVQSGTNTSVPWTAPSDIDIDPMNPLSGFGTLPDDRLTVALANGSVVSLKTSLLSREKILGLLRWTDSEHVDPDRLSRIDEELTNHPLMTTPYPRYTANGTSHDRGTVDDEKLFWLTQALSWTNDYGNRYGIPPNRSYFDANGKPYLSWRVHLLGRLGYGNLYQQFRLNEPWDSPHNLPLLDQMPDIFRVADDPSSSFTTRYQVLRGPDAPWTGQLVDGMELGPGRMNPYTIAIVEVGEDRAVPWTAPLDADFDINAPLAALGDVRSGQIRAGMFEPAILNLSLIDAAEYFKALVSPLLAAGFDLDTLRRRRMQQGERSLSHYWAEDLARKLERISWDGIEYQRIWYAPDDHPLFHDSQGRPLLSWRALLFDNFRSAGYAQGFDFKQPWDSPDNLALLTQMPDVFRDREDAWDSTTTTVHVFAGPGAPFRRFPRDYSIYRNSFANWYRDEFTDGRDVTWYVVNAGPSKVRPWTQPVDLDYSPQVNPLALMGLTTSDVITGVTAYGSLRRISASASPELLRALITYAGGEPFNGNVTNMGAILPGITVTGTTDSRLVISEGKLGAVQVVLDKPGDVRIDVALSVNGVMLADKTSLVFTTANWSVPQALTLKAIDDDLIDGAESVVMTLSVNDAATTMNEFDALPDIVIPVFNVNDDVPRILTAGVTGVVLTEGGAAETISVSLSHAPLSNVTIAVNNSIPQQWTSNVSSLVFTPSNWSVPQILTLLATNEAIVDGTINGNVRLSVSNSADAAFRGLPEQPISVHINDNDVPSIHVNITDGETVVSEDGLTDSLDVRLAVQPANDVYVTVVSLVNPTVQVSSAELHFTPANWNVSQTITVSAINESLTTSTILELRVDSRSGPYQTAAAVQTNVRVLDDESAYPVFSNVNDPVIAIEGGQAASMSVRLSVAPVGPVQLRVLPLNPNELNVQDGVLQFDATNWNQPQTVTIIAVDEVIADGDRYEYVRFVWGPNLSAPYLRQPDFSVGLQAVDNEIAAIEVVETDGSTVVAESGATDSFGVRLSSRPNGPIELTVTSRDLTAVTVSPSTLRFTPENWNTLQTVTVTAADDVLADGIQLASIRLTVNLAFSSGGYDHAPSVDVSTTTLDNELATLLVQETNGTTIVSESGTTDAVQVRLSAVPTSTVTVLVSVDDVSEVGASVSSLTFTASNWNVPQSVSLTGLDDAIVDGPVLSQLRFAFAAASPGAYASALLKSVAVTTSDNEIAGLVLVESGGFTLVSEAGSSDTVTVRLTARPLQNVTLTIQSLDTTEFTVSPMTLNFTPANWNLPQTVTVVGVDDSLVDGSQTSALRISVHSLSQLQFQGITTNVLVTTTDDELSVPSILAPASLVSSLRPTIMWSPVVGAASYRVIVVNRTTGGTVIVDTVVASSNLQVSTDLGIGAFAVRVQAISITGRTSLWSPERNFRIDTAPTISPIPLYVNSSKPTFKWNTLVGAVYYDLQVDGVLDIRPQIIRRTTLTGTSFVAPANLRLGLYEVKIRAIDAGGVPAKWSALTSFYVVTAPTPLSPPTATFSARPKFSWRSVEGAIAYDLKYQKNSTGQITEVNGLQSTTFVPSADLFSGAYRWWVRARGMYDVVGAWSAVQEFMIGGSPTLTPIASPVVRNPRLEWSRVEGAVRYFLRVDRIDVPQSYYIRQESLTAAAYTVPVSLKPGLYRVWVKAISVSGQVTGWSKSIDITVVQADDDRNQSRNPASFLPADLLIPELGPEMTRDSRAASEDVIVVQSASDVSRIPRPVDFRGARDVEPKPGISQEVLAEPEVLQTVNQAVFETTDWYSQL